MTPDPDNLSPESHSSPAATSPCTYYLQSVQQEFPRNLLCIDEGMVRMSILSHTDEFSSEAFSLRQICIPSSIQVISEDCFDCCGDLSHLAFEFGSKLTIISRAAFWCCSALQSICIASSVETISEHCFGHCRCLSHLRFEICSRVAILGASAFQYCLSLESLRIPTSVETISEACFKECKGLSKLTFESGSRLSAPGDFAFSGCSALRSLYCPPSLCQVTG
jgi:hypothetical protein